MASCLNFEKIVINPSKIIACRQCYKYPCSFWEYRSAWE